MKENIIDNVSRYSAQQLVDSIRAGIITFEELVNDTDGEFVASKRREVEDILKNGDDKDWAKAFRDRTIEAARQYLNTYPNGKHRGDARGLINTLEQEQKKKDLESTTNNAWTRVDKSDIDELRKFINGYPGSNHINEANTLINNILLDEIIGVNAETLVSQIREFQTKKSLTPGQKDNNIVDTINRYLNDKKISKTDFLNKIREDHNLLNAGVVKTLINKGVISIADLTGVGIDKLFIQKMFNGDSARSFTTPERLDKIHKQSTEVYFWGIPSSGKSCALGAILSVVTSGHVAKSMELDAGSQGYGYMTKLGDLFKNGQVGTLIEGTSVDSFYEMGFDLVDVDEKTHPITCIDMAGELMRCMYKANARDPMSEMDEIMLETLTKVLIDNRSVNRKMHIFVIEYGAEDRLYEGLPQRVYLDGALSYIKNTGIFKKDTDAIYIMITKADKGKNLNKENLTNYIDENYLGFYNGLKQICKDNGINRGVVERIAFSLGEVCFQNYCRFDSRTAENVVGLILKRSASFKGGKRGMFEKIFRG